MIWALMLTNLLAIFVTAYIRYGSEGLEFASPIAMGRGVWFVAMGVALGGIIVSMVIGRSRLRDRQARRSMLELLVLPLGFAFLWAKLPARTRDYGLGDWLGLSAIIGAVILIMWLDRGNWRKWGVTGRNFMPALCRLAIPMTVMVIVILITSWMFGWDDVNWTKAVVAMATYPFYALPQLLLFQVFLVHRLRRLTDSTPAVLIVSSGMFSLMHWPNPLVMAACGVGAAVWTWVYLTRANVYALALAMGLTAAMFGRLLPNDLVQNTRVGPIYVERRMVHKQALKPSTTTSERSVQVRRSSSAR